MLAALMALSACDAPASNETNAVHQTKAPSGPIVRLNPVPGRPAAGYFTLRIEGDKGALVRSPRRRPAGSSCTSDARGEYEPDARHPRLPVRNGERLVFGTGGRHLMLFDISPTIEAGGEITLIFQFERGAEQRLTARIVPTAATSIMRATRTLGRRGRAVLA